MNVIFDISPVGKHAETRTGLARNAWSMAQALRQRLGDNVSFSACGSIWASVQVEELLTLHPELSSAIQPVGSAARSVHRWQQALERFNGTSKIPPRALLKSLERALVNVSRVQNTLRRPINKVRLQQADIFHSSYARVPAQVKTALPGRCVLTVHDLTPLILDERYFLPGQRAITRRIINSIGRDDWVITVSDATRSDLCQMAAVDPNRVITVHEAASLELFYPVTDADRLHAVRRRYGIPDGQFLLTLHSLAPHKNLPHLIRSFTTLLRQERSCDLTLVVAGGQEKSVGQMQAALIADGIDLRNVIFTGFVDDVDLATLYSAATAFVFPSLYEGFGLPVLEAMQCGCPVIVSNISSLPELVGEAGMLVPPTDESTLCETMLRLTSDTELRSCLSERCVEQAKRFSWTNTVDFVLRVYQRIMDN
ncbi:MAG: glycosyltransferase family 4 protein [Caldilineaceae bacterium]|nr:glycosyltransferase family 4 protein [Caldilineaceae bacterium]